MLSLIYLGFCIFHHGSYKKQLSIMYEKTQKTL